MDGKYLDKNTLLKSIQNWKNIIFFNKKWEGNNLHIDEIEGLEKIEKTKWIDVSFIILNLLANQCETFNNSLILFLHIDIEYSSKKMSLEKLSLDWLRENVSEFTPPSLNFTSLEYYTNFYKKELIRCIPDASVVDFFHCLAELDFFYRTYFDKSEKMYSREIYIFIKNNPL